MIHSPCYYKQIEPYNCNKAQFSNIFMYREQFGQSYDYDEDRNVISTSTLSGQKSDIKYDSAKNIDSYTQPGRDSKVTDNQYLFYYGTAEEKKKHLLLRSRTPMHQTDYYSYDSYGNRTSSRRVDYRVYTDGAAESAYPYIRTETAYTSDGNYTASSKDERGNVTTQVVNANDGTLTSVTDPTGQTVNYTYDASKRVTSVQTTGDGKTYKNAYTYEDDRIKTVSHNTTSDTANDVTYTFDYDELGRKTTVKVGSQTLSTNVYENNRNGLISEVQYGNGGKVGYTYDDFDRLTGVKYDGETSDRYSYEYGVNGQAAKVKDNHLNRTVKTEYDLSDRPCQVEIYDDEGNELLYHTRLKYDKLNNLQRFSEQIGDENHRSEYTYDRDNRITEVQYDGSTHKVSYTYDALGRVSSRVAECGNENGKLTSTYTYVDGGYGTNSTTPLVKKIAQNGISFEYAYDSRGNITSEKRGELTTTYQYDAIGQLIRVNDPHENASWVYNYDRGGNITSKVRYAYTTGTLGTVFETIPYTYGDSNWKDKLTAYNGQAITYDAIGNPLNDGNWTYEWQAGRQLKKMSAEGTSVSFEYDHDGMRIQKVVEQDWYPETTSYIYHGKLLTHMTVDYTDLNEIPQQKQMHFFYDGENLPAYVDYNGTIYSYVHNLHRDTVGLLDSSGALVVEYEYNPWGKLISITGPLAGTLGKENPFRYRGNVYDEETGLYYIQDRYYSPSYQRFLIRDDAEVDVSAGVLSVHPFAYCKNNPVKFMDTNGQFINMLAGAIAGGIVGAISAALSGDDILAGAAVGAATGAIAGIAVDVAVATGGIGGIAFAAIVGGAANGTNYLATETINGRSIDGGTLAIEIATGALSNIFTFGLSGGTLKKVPGKILDNMKKNWTKTVYARTTRKVAGRIVRKTAKTVMKKNLANIAAEAAVSSVVGFGAVLSSKYIQRVFLPR